MARRRRSEWIALVAKWEKSGLSGRRFAERVGVNHHTLSWWKWRLEAQARSLATGVEDAEAPISFVEVSDIPVIATPSAPIAPAVLTLVLGDRRIEVPVGFSGETLQQLVDVLEAGQ